MVFCGMESVFQPDLSLSSDVASYSASRSRSSCHCKFRFAVHGWYALRMPRSTSIGRSKATHGRASSPSGRNRTTRPRHFCQARGIRGQRSIDTATQTCSNYDLCGYRLKPLPSLSTQEALPRPGSSPPCCVAVWSRWN